MTETQKDDIFDECAMKESGLFANIEIIDDAALEDLLLVYSGAGDDVSRLRPVSQITSNNGKPKKGAVVHTDEPAPGRLFIQALEKSERERDQALLPYFSSILETRRGLTPEKASMMMGVPSLFNQYKHAHETILYDIQEYNARYERHLYAPLTMAWKESVIERFWECYVNYRKEFTTAHPGKPFIIGSNRSLPHDCPALTFARGIVRKMFEELLKEKSSQLRLYQKKSERA